VSLGVNFERVNESSQDPWRTRVISELIASRDGQRQFILPLFYRHHPLIRVASPIHRVKASTYHLHSPQTIHGSALIENCTLLDAQEWKDFPSRPSKADVTDER
jgi:hypothetical protein